MIINYLILAHSNYQFLDHLIEGLNSSNVRFYIHIDKKVKEIYENKKSNVFVLKKRIKINWGGFGMIEATLELLQNAFENNKSSKSRYVLISGADYPIRSNIFINNILKEDLEYINISPAPLSHKPIKRFEYFHFDYARKVINFKFVLRYFCEKTLKILRIKRKIPFKIFVGSQWFALTNNCVGYILEEEK
jgi:hypothetical protein